MFSMEAFTEASMEAVLEASIEGATMEASVEGAEASVEGICWHLPWRLPWKSGRSCKLPWKHPWKMSTRGRLEGRGNCLGGFHDLPPFHGSFHTFNECLHTFQGSFHNFHGSLHILFQVALVRGTFVMRCRSGSTGSTAWLSVAKVHTVSLSTTVVSAGTFSPWRRNRVPDATANLGHVCTRDQSTFVD